MKNRFKKISLLLLTLIPVLVLSPSAAVAASGDGADATARYTVAVNSRDFGGDWLLNGVWHSGPARLEMEAGSYPLYIGYYQVVYLTVADNGALSVTNPQAVAVDGQTLTFQTTSLLIDTADYAGKWNVSGVNAAGSSGTSYLTVVKAARYGLEVGGLGARFFFEVDALGVVSIANSASAAADGNRIVFNTVPVVVDPGGYEGSWSVYTASHYTKGAAVIPLVADIPLYGLKPGISTIHFGVGPDGEVRTDHPGATGGNSQLTLNTTPVLVNPGKFNGSWNIDQTRARKFAKGAARVDLPVGLSYQFSAGAWGRFKVDIDALGNVTVPNGVSALGGPASLRFNTIRVTVDAREYPGTWSIDYIGGPSFGRRTLNLLPLTRYLLETQSGQNGFFLVAADCHDNEAIHEVNGDTIYLRCPVSKTPQKAGQPEPQEEDVVVEDTSAESSKEPETEVVVVEDTPAESSKEPATDNAGGAKSKKSEKVKKSKKSEKVKKSKKNSTD